LIPSLSSDVGQSSSRDVHVLAIGEAGAGLSHRRFLAWLGNAYAPWRTRISLVEDRAATTPLPKGVNDLVISDLGVVYGQALATRLVEDPADLVVCVELPGVARLGAAVLRLLGDGEGGIAPAAVADGTLERACRRAGLTVSRLSAAGHWLPAAQPAAIARIVLGTKGQSLLRLAPLLSCSVVDELLLLEVADWRRAPRDCLAMIARRFGDARLAVRSSCRAEDAWTASQAGCYCSVVGVAAQEGDALRGVIDAVIDSYGGDAGDEHVLIQRMIEAPSMSGVMLSRTLTYGAPYVVINYATGDSATDAVTAGQSDGMGVMIVARGCPPPAGAPACFTALLAALAEVEEILGHDDFDTEFAVTADGIVHLLQVRPVVRRHSDPGRFDAALIQARLQAREELSAARPPSAGVLGRRAIYSVMTDWNPAEILGLAPRRLAIDLYRFLITDAIWACQRHEVGYRDLRGHRLLRLVMGRPYVDVRASLNSFVPAAVPEPLAERLIDHALDRLAERPDLHDKVEFEISLTCLGFDFAAKARALAEAGFTAAETRALAEALRGVQRRIVEQTARSLLDVAALQETQAGYTAGPDPLADAARLLEECRQSGTLAFAHLARAGFVAMAWLSGAIDEGLITRREADGFLKSLRTVASELSDDAQAVRDGRLPFQALVDRYGHLRPGTYDVTAPSYDEAPERYLRSLVMVPPRGAAADPHVPFIWSEDARRAVGARLGELGVGLDFDGFDRFLRQAIEGREFSKFVFTRTLSRAITRLRVFADGHGLAYEDVAHLPLAAVLARRPGLAGLAAEERRRHALAQAAELPPVILAPEDIDAFIPGRTLANFVGSGAVTGSVADLTRGAVPDITGRVVLIASADPGFDWVFGHALAGLITAYGGPNSHMAVRAAEFGVPAAIGVGDTVLNRLRAAGLIRLDCAARRIEPL